jgi:hypothetical protein
VRRVADVIGLGVNRHQRVILPQAYLRHQMQNS